MLPGQHASAVLGAIIGISRMLGMDDDVAKCSTKQRTAGTGLHESLLTPSS